jgi:hypothetical protein
MGILMKKFLLGAFGGMFATSALAGGMAEPTMEPEVVAAATSSSSAGIIVPILLILLIAAAASGGSSGE